MLAVGLLILYEARVDNGTYVFGKMLKDVEYNNQPVTELMQKSGDIVYKCYLPDTGKTAKVNEMSRYFFFVQLDKYKPQNIVLSSEFCQDFVDANCDDKKGKYNFIKLA